MRIKDTFALTLTIGAAATTLLIAAATVVGREHPAAPPPGLSIVLKYAAGDTRRTSMQLRELDDSYAELAGAGVSTNANYAYLWIRAENSTLRDIEAVFANRTRNYYTEILEPMPLGARILHRQGDIVPVSESPMRHHRTAFPIIAPAGKAVEFVVEYHGPRGIVIDPVVLGTADYLSFALSERSMGSLVSGALFCLLFFNTASGLMLGKKYFFAIAAFIAALSFFYLRQSRLLMLIIDPLFYPEWLFPLTISLNLASAMAFSRSVFGRRMTGLETWTIRGIVVAAVLLTAAGAALAPYAIADILNLLSIVALCATLPSVYRSYAAGEKEPIWLFISFSPWIAMMLMDILTGFLGRRASPLGEYRHAFSLVASLFLLSITLQKMQGLAAEARAKAATLEMERMRTNMDGRLGSLSELRTALLERIDHRLRQPLDGIIASARLLERSYAVPRVAAASRLIVDEATELKRSVASELNLERSVPGPGPDAGAVPAGDDADDADEGDDAGDRDDELTIKPALRSRVAIFDADSRNAERTRRIIKASGIEATAMSDRLSVLAASASGDIDVLVIEPESTGDQAFLLCGLLRAEKNMLELPILMINDYYGDYLMRRGYAAGVNDYLTKPFDASELSARIQSLAKLRQVAAHNFELSRSEKEKNAFLFFLTHNVNTPLTILLNRVEELEGLPLDEGLCEILDDLRYSAREINDIVQNVLISFRLADGRQTLRMEAVELGPIMAAVERDLRKRSDAKGQRLAFESPGAVPLVTGDPTAIKGILYNLVDNAIKYSPKGGAIGVRLVPGSPVRIEVSDSGPGIPESDLPRLFCRFERLSARPTGGESSTGLGLYVAAELAAMGGGDIAYRPGGHGACFVLSIPERAGPESGHA